MRIIPAIDILGGRCVRLSRGDYATQKTYRENPLDVAKELEENGIEYLHLVDLDGARSKHIVNYNILESIAKNTSLKIDFGGGIKSQEDVDVAFQCGASQITVGTIAAQDPVMFLTWLTTYGKEKIMLGADSYNRKIATQGWMEKADGDVIDFIAGYAQKGISYVVCTDIVKDGMLQGTSNALYQEILLKTNIKLIASGGVSSINDLIELKEIGCEGVIIGKAIYEGYITLKDLSKLC